jgi:alpha-D-ribose 1-methylphosphonate 5-triphosphate synthase subunit PhnG
MPDAVNLSQNMTYSYSAARSRTVAPLSFLADSAWQTPMRFTSQCHSLLSPSDAVFGRVREQDVAGVTYSRGAARSLTVAPLSLLADSAWQPPMRADSVQVS